MAIRIIDQYGSGKVDPVTAAWPDGEPRNVTADGAGDGTPFEVAGYKDWEGLRQGLILQGSITPSGTSDTAMVSQLVEGVRAVSRNYFDDNVADATVGYKWILESGINRVRLSLTTFDGGGFIGNAVHIDHDEVSVARVALVDGNEERVIIGTSLPEITAIRLNGITVCGKNDDFDKPIDLDGQFSFIMSSSKPGFTLNGASASEGYSWRVKSAGAGKGLALAISTDGWTTDDDRWEYDALGNYFPTNDGDVDVGKSGNRVDNYWGVTGSIQTSQGSLKAGLKNIPQTRLKKFDGLQAKTYQFKSAVAKKGKDKARWHQGYVAEDVKAAFGSDAENCSFYCSDIVPIFEMVESDVEVQVTEKRTITETVVREINGEKVAVMESKEIDSPVYDKIPVVDELGRPVVDETPDGKGGVHKTQRVVMEARMHKVRKLARTQVGTEERTALRVTDILVAEVQRLKERITAFEAGA